MFTTGFNIIKMKYYYYIIIIFIEQLNASVKISNVDENSRQIVYYTGKRQSVNLINVNFTNFKIQNQR